MLRRALEAGERTGEAKGALEAARAESGSESLHPGCQLIVPDVTAHLGKETAVTASAPPARGVGPVSLLSPEAYPDQLRKPAKKTENTFEGPTFLAGLSRFPGPLSGLTNIEDKRRHPGARRRVHGRGYGKI